MRREDRDYHNAGCRNALPLILLTLARLGLASIRRRSVR